MTDLVVSEQSDEYPARTERVYIWCYEDEYSDLSSIGSGRTCTRRVEDLAVGSWECPRGDVHGWEQGATRVS